jgi:hypothetical protein
MDVAQGLCPSGLYKGDAGCEQCMTEPHGVLLVLALRRDL